MKTLLHGLRGAVVMIVTWTIGWGLGFGGLIEAFVDPHGRIEDIWPVVMAVPGAAGGAIMSGLLALGERRRSFDEVALVRFAGWGALTGLVLGLGALAMGVASARPLAAARLFGTAAGLGGVAAVASALFFRVIARRRAARVGGARA